MPRRVIELLECWRDQVRSHSVLDIWRMSLLCLMWCIWRARNAKCFDDCETSVIELKNILVKLLYTWTRVYNTSQFSNFSDIVVFCSSFSH